MKLSKIFKLCLALLIVVSAALLVWGFFVGFETNDAQAVDVLLGWAYIMIGLAIVSWVVIGLIISAKNNPKSLIKIGIAILGIAALVAVAYLLAPGTFAAGREGLDDAFTLKLTDTVLNLTYIVGGAAILAIIVGEVRLAINNKK